MGNVDLVRTAAHDDIAQRNPHPHSEGGTIVAVSGVGIQLFEARI